MSGQPDRGFKQVPAAPDEFPNGPALRGKVYSVTDPAGERVVCMSFDTWSDFGTLLENLRQVAQNQDRRLKELNAAFADAQQRLANLREVRRAERRADAEEQVKALFDPTSPKES